MEALTLSPYVLTWAAEQAGKSYETLVEGIAKRERDRQMLLEGKLTNAQAEKVAKLTGVPYGLLFLPEPPVLTRPDIPDLRQTVDPLPLSPDFQEVYEDALLKQEWYAQHLLDEGATPLPFVGSFPENANAERLAADISKTLDLSPSLRKTAATADLYFGVLAERAEEAGVLVMKSGIVKSNTRRSLSVKEFRGFALVHGLAPLVFINGRDYEVASVFTLMHELAHIWIGQSGVSDLADATFQHKNVERLCNQVAADVLVPKAEFLERWGPTTDIASLAQTFRVSRLVVARRALDLGLIGQDRYNEVAAQARKDGRSSSSGGDAHKTIPVRNSKRFTKALVKSVMAGDTLIRDAASLLHVKAGTVVRMGRRGESIGD
jgi:Zn-dependent peptidase ImmA (M78 family)